MRCIDVLWTRSKLSLDVSAAVVSKWPGSEAPEQLQLTEMLL